MCRDAHCAESLEDRIYSSALLVSGAVKHLIRDEYLLSNDHRNCGIGMRSHVTCAEYLILLQY